MNYWIKFPCNRLQYETLPILQLKREYGLVSLSVKTETIVGNMEDRFRGRTKNVSFEQAKLILEHVVKNGLNEVAEGFYYKLASRQISSYLDMPKIATSGLFNHFQ